VPRLWINLSTAIEKRSQKGPTAA